MSESRRKERQRKRRDRRQLALCCVAAAALLLTSVVGSAIYYVRLHPKQEEVVETTTTAYFDPTKPFTLSDLTARQLERCRIEGRIRVSDGPRGISVGDPLDKVLACYPTSYQSLTHYTEDYREKQLVEQQILYCAEYFENLNGFMTALPPRGLLTMDNNSVTVTLTAPTSAYPAGTRDEYKTYEHVYCLYTFEPEGMTVSSIELGIAR